MAKNRLIFTLLLDHGNYMLSRNFRLQKVGDLSWIRENYDFDSIAYSIDELVVLNVQRGEKDVQGFASELTKLIHGCFMPVAAGGGIRTMDDAYAIIAAGADKLVVNSNLYNNKPLIREMVSVFGSQCVIASIDYKNVNGRNEVFIENGAVNSGLIVEEAVQNAIDLSAGEIYLTSMDKDGTGQGLDIDTLSKVVSISPVHVIGSGGVGREDQFVEGMQKAGLQATSTANLFNFIADGLTEAREYIHAQGIEMAQWDLGFFKKPV
jgi:cyclase